MLLFDDYGKRSVGLILIIEEQSRRRLHFSQKNFEEETNDRDFRTEHQAGLTPSARSSLISA